MSEPTYRCAGVGDVGAIFNVRITVLENKLDREQLAELGITEESVTASLQDDHRAWVAECDHTVVGFSMACSSDGRVFALFVHPDFAGHGIGIQLLRLAVGWLRDIGISMAWLTTDPRSRAASFCLREGWRSDHQDHNGDIRFEISLDEEAS
jgi:GNAT superfamily N-acetyltransferase